MDTSIGRLMRADPATVFRLAAAVEEWPRLLPHYRWVRVLADDGAHRTVSMAARREVVAGLAIPLRWTSIVTANEQLRRIEFEHVQGITRGMRVAWTLEPVATGVQVQIRHVFEPAWPVPELLLRLVVGDYFVNGVAKRTLQCIADLAEARPHK